MISPNVMHIRFYAELNDFLTKSRQFKRFEYPYSGNPNVKDLIEAIGVPHTEVDLILVNSVSVGFDYRIQPDDDISVYPVFESIDIKPVTHLRPAPLRDIRFIADANLGRLARYLRMMGFDTMYQNDFEDKQIIECSLKERRIILTRDQGILKHKVVTHGYWIRNTQVMKQIEEVVLRFDLARHIHAFTRCMICNGTISPVSKASIERHLQNGTKRDFNQFYQCDSCRKIYWKGSHYQRMKALVEEVQGKKLKEKG
jgi:uncharacterized protein with PIN domain